MNAVQLNNFLLLKDRMWRKTRSRNASTECVGVDINRNFGYEWDGKYVITSY